MTMAKNMGPRRYAGGASTNMPWAGPVKITRVDGSVEVISALRYTERRTQAGNGRIRVKANLKRRIHERDKLCQICGNTTGPFEVDHIRPFSKGGWNVESNLQLLCRPCNQRKAAKWK